MIYTAGMIGIVDEAAIFSSGLTKDEIRDIMDNGLIHEEISDSVEPSDKLATTWGTVQRIGMYLIHGTKRILDKSSNHCPYDGIF